MRVIAKSTLRVFWELNPDSEQQLKAWYAEAKHAQWTTPAVIKEKYRSVSILKNGRAIFNICGNKYRLVAKINYPCQIVFVRFIGTHISNMTKSMWRKSDGS